MLALLYLRIYLSQTDIPSALIVYGSAHRREAFAGRRAALPYMCDMLILVAISVNHTQFTFKLLCSIIAVIAHHRYASSLTHFLVLTCSLIRVLFTGNASGDIVCMNPR